MSPTITIDTSGFKKAALELQKTSSRSIVDFINGQSLAVAVAAIKLTEQANKDKIAHDLGQTGWAVRTNRKGRLVKGKRVIAEDSFAARIILKYFNLTGKWKAEGKTLTERAARLIGRRLSAVGFIRSGWIPAIRGLSSIVKKKPLKAGGGFAGARQFGKPKGKVTPARATLGLIQCTIYNSINDNAKITKDVGYAGLVAALKYVEADMIQALANRLKKDLAKFGAK